MFSNNLIRSMVKTSDEQHLRLSQEDWHVVLEANKSFSQSPELWHGNSDWGKYLAARIGGNAAKLDFTNSIELCCGNGFLYFSFKDLFTFSDSSYFIDLSSSQCAAFERRCLESGVPVPRIISGDIGRLPMEDGSLGMVYGHSFLHHLPDVGAYLRETCRVLRKGGRFITFHEPTATAPILESFPRSLIKKIDAGSLTDIWLIKSEVIRTILLESGFSRVEVFPTGLTAALMVTPWQLVLNKLGFPYQFESLPRILSLMYAADRALPSFILDRFAPSIALVAYK